MEKEPVPPLREGGFTKGGRNQQPMTPRPSTRPAPLGNPANAGNDSARSGGKK
jgi:hypothetical protein